MLQTPAPPKKKRLTRKNKRTLRNVARLFTLAIIIALSYYTWTEARSDILQAWAAEVQPWIDSLFTPQSDNVVEVTATPTGTTEPTRTQTATQTATMIVPTELLQDLLPTPETLVKVRTSVNNGSLNLRIGPGTKYAVLQVLSEGQELVFLECVGDWALVSTVEVEGYVYGGYLTEVVCP